MEGKRKKKRDPTPLLSLLGQLYISYISCFKQSWVVADAAVVEVTLFQRAVYELIWNANDVQ